MPYAILRFQKRKAGSVAACERHNERKKEGRLIALMRQAGDSDDSSDSDVGIPPASVTDDTAK